MLFQTKTAVFFRGLSGAGKSTAARMLQKIAIDNGQTVAVHETDSYFYDENGVYTIDFSKMGEYHEANLQAFKHSIENGVHLVINSNTNTQYWEFVRYLQVSIEAGYSTVVYDLYDSGLTDQQLFERSQHGFPLEKYKSVRAFYEREYTGLDPRPFYER